MNKEDYIKTEKQIIQDAYIKDRSFFCQDYKGIGQIVFEGAADGLNRVWIHKSQLKEKIKDITKNDFAIIWNSSHDISEVVDKLKQFLIKKLLEE